jgi:hypothetical protein
MKKAVDAHEGCPLGNMCDADLDMQEYEHEGSMIRMTCSCGTSGPWEVSFSEANFGWNLLFPIPSPPKGAEK